MKSFVEEFIMMAVKGVNEFNSKIENVADILSRTLSDDKDVDIEEFIQMYNTRLYNIDNKRSDIKFMKRNDFEGAYILYNSTKNIYYSGHSGKVMKKIERYYNGYENQKFYKEIQFGNKFFVRIKRFDKTSYLSINELEKELCLVYDKRVMIENLKRQKAQEKIRQQKEIERRKAEKLQEKKIRKKEKRILVFKKHCKKGLWLIIILLILIFFLCIYKEYKKYVPLCFDAKEIKGMQYAEVSDNLIDKGFNNISYNPIADLEIESMEKENEISKIIVNNISDFDRNSKFHVDSKIIIEYHTLKEIPIGMSPNEIIGQDYNKITKKLKEKGFVNIECTPLDDLIVGWLHDENEIESIKIDGVEEFMSNNVFRLDAKFDIEYHSFD